MLILNLKKCIRIREKQLMKQKNIFEQFINIFMHIIFIFIFIPTLWKKIF